MTWFSVDDGLHDHRKVRKLGKDKAAAMGVWTLCGSWAADEITEGFVPAEVVQRYDPGEKLAARLVAVGLWHAAEDDGESGYRFHEWSEDSDGTPRNLTRAEVEVSRANGKAGKSKGGRVGNHRRWHVNRGIIDARCQFCQGKQGSDGTESVSDNRSDTDRSTDHSTDRKTSDPNRPTPTPTPTPTTDSPNGESGEDAREARSTPKRSRGTRIPEGFEPTERMIAWARSECPDVGRTEHANFCDYWAGAPGAKGRKADWEATWRKWMRKAQQDADDKRQRRSGPSRLRDADAEITEFLNRSLADTGTEGPSSRSLYVLPEVES